MTEPDVLTANPFQPHPPADSQPIRQGDNTREFQVKWHAVQFAAAYLALGQSHGGLTPGEPPLSIGPHSDGLLSAVSAFMAATGLSHTERVTFLDAVIVAVSKNAVSTG